MLSLVELLYPVATQYPLAIAGGLDPSVEKMKQQEEEDEARNQDSSTVKLAEVIRHPPRNPKVWFEESFIKRLKAGQAKATKQLDLLFQENPNKETLEYFLKDATNRTIWLDDLEAIQAWFLKTLAEKITDFGNLWEYASRQQVHRYDRAKFLGCLVNGIQRLLEELNVHHQSFVFSEEQVERFQYYLEQYESEEINPSIAQRLMTVAEVTEFLISVLKSAEQKLEPLIRTHREEDLAPQTEPVETLYHASVNATAIATEGFSDKTPSAEGLGGAQSDKSGKPAISFTSDLYVAKEVARTLKEAIMVAKGKLTLNQLRSMASHAGVLDEVEKLFQDLKGKNPSYGNVVDTFEFYRNYLAMAESAGKRYNPLFFGDMEKLMRTLRSKKEEDVGILVCKVDMTNPDIEYLYSMHEYRVPSRAVISIEKVLK